MKSLGTLTAGLLLTMVFTWASNANAGCSGSGLAWSCTRREHRWPSTNGNK